MIDVLHWVIDHLNVTQEEKDEQHAALSDATPAPLDPPTEDAPAPLDPPTVDGDENK